MGEACRSGKAVVRIPVANARLMAHIGPSKSKAMHHLHLSRPGAHRGKVGLDGFSALLAAFFVLVVPGRGDGATLSGSFIPLPSGTNVNLSAEGQLDWGQWGLVNAFSYNHKYGVAQQITYSFLTDAIYADGPALWDGGVSVFSWTNGTPTAVVAATTNGPSIAADKLQGNNPTGFQIQCPADTTSRRLKIYVSTLGANATLSAHLNGGSPSYNLTLKGSGLTSASNGVFILDFQADSPGNTNTITFTSSDSAGFLTLQAATLSGADVPPTVTLSAPTNGTTLSAPATFSVSATAADSDGTVTNLALYNGTNLLGRATGNSLSRTITNLPAGAWNLFAVATDNGGLSVTSFPAAVYVLANGGTLQGAVATPPASVDLTAEGTADWVHWGLSSASSLDRKAGVAQIIPNVTPINVTTNDLNQYGDNLAAFSWTDGTPTVQAGGSTTGVFIYSANQPPGGFQLTVPATNLLRRLKVYVGLYGAQGQFNAAMSDWSAAPYSDSSLSAAYNNGYAVYTLTFASPTPGASLNITWTPASVFDTTYGNLTWQAATLWQTAYVPALPDLGTAGASNATATAATVYGTVNPNGTATTAWFQWGLTTNYGVNTLPVTNLTGPNPLTISYALSGLTPATTYHFRLTATNSAGITNGGDQMFTTALLQPVITNQPRSRAAGLGGTATFSVGVTSPPTNTYQWLFFGTNNLAGQTNATLSLTNVQAANFGGYSVVVNNGYGSATSTLANLTLAVRPSIYPATVSLNTFFLTFTTEFGPTYLVDYKDQLTGATWLPFTSVAGTGSPITISDNTITNTTRFFRVRVL